jgi:hypothetical protein
VKASRVHNIKTHKQIKVCWRVGIGSGDIFFLTLYIDPRLFITGYHMEPPSIICLGTGKQATAAPQS